MHKKISETKCLSKQAGAGFIELLVSLVILAIGLLGVLSLQARGIQSNQQALFTTDVTLLTHDIANRILAYDLLRDPGNVFDGIDITAAAGNCGDFNAVVAVDCNGWIAAFAGSNLPSGRGNVDWVAGIYTITIRWDQNRVGGLPMANTIAIDCASADPQLTLTCYQLEVQP
jgi:type IV pilus assembly protein PilV